MVLLLTYVPKGKAPAQRSADAAPKRPLAGQRKDAPSKTAEAQAASDAMAEVSRFAARALSGEVDAEEVARLPKSYRATDCFPDDDLTQNTPSAPTPDLKPSPVRQEKAPGPRSR